MVKPPKSETGYSPDVLLLNRPSLATEPRWKSQSTVSHAESIPLIIEVVSTNWRDDYLDKAGDYEEIGIPEYWIIEDTALDGFPSLKQVSVDYLGLGGRRFIGYPKQPTISIYQLVEGEYQVSLFRKGDRIVSSIFPELNLTVQEIFAAGLQS